MGNVIDVEQLFYLYYIHACPTWFVDPTSAPGWRRDLTDGFCRSIQLRQEREIESEPVHIRFGRGEGPFMREVCFRKDMALGENSL